MNEKDNRVKFSTYIALGGVPTGMWKAKQQLSAAGYISNIGWTLIASAISASTGKMTFAIATFDVNSVSVWQTTHMRNNNARNGIPWKTCRLEPSIRDIPDTFPPSARANPPPKRKTSDLKKRHVKLIIDYVM